MGCCREHSPIYRQPATAFVLDYLQNSVQGVEVLGSGKGSPPSATARVVVDNVVASSRVIARIRRRFFTVQLLLEVVVHGESDQQERDNVRNLPGVRRSEIGRDRDGPYRFSGKWNRNDFACNTG
jgi:hypothetical protein